MSHFPPEAETISGHDDDPTLLGSIWLRVAEVKLSDQQEPITLTFEAVEMQLGLLEGFIKDAREKLKEGELHLLDDDGYVRECTRPVTSEFVQALVDTISSQLNGVAHMTPVLPWILEERLKKQQQ